MKTHASHDEPNCVFRECDNIKFPFIVIAEERR